MVKTGHIFVSGWLQDRGSSFAAERSVESGLCRCNYFYGKRTECLYSDSFTALDLRGVSRIFPQ